MQIYDLHVKIITSLLRGIRSYESAFFVNNCKILLHPANFAVFPVIIIANVGTINLKNCLLIKPERHHNVHLLHFSSFSNYPECSLELYLTTFYYVEEKLEDEKWDVRKDRGGI